MATNNRLVDYNRHLIHGDQNRLNTFLANLSGVSGATFYPAKLRDNLRTVPTAYRDADQLYLAGAIKTGAILGYDLAGSIVEMPFSRSSTGWGCVDMLMRSYATNLPILDEIYHKGQRLGIVVEELSNSGGIPNINVRGQGNANRTAFYNATGSGYAPTGWYKFGELEGATSTAYRSDTLTTATRGAYLAMVFGTDPLSYAEMYLDITEIYGKRELRVHPDFNAQSTFITIGRYGRLDAVNPSIQERLQYKYFEYNGRKIVKIVVSNYTFGTYLGLSIWDLSTTTDFPCDPSCRVGVGWLSKGSFDKTRVSASSTTTVTKQEDILTINLTQTSDIHISTSKGVYEFPAQPAGVFDYKSKGIINCKIYSIAIKHI